MWNLSVARASACGVGVEVRRPCLIRASDPHRLKSLCENQDELWRML